MVEIILVRHGETQWNTTEVFRGRADIALNENGFAQGKLLGEYLKDENIGAVYSGPLQRAVNTAEAIAGHHSFPVKITESLNDIDCGAWEGLPLKEVKEKYEEDYQDWLDTPEQIRIPGGESLDEVRNRAMPFIWEAIKQTDKGNIVLVSHRAVHKVLISAFLDMDNSAFWSFKLDTAGLTRFTFDGRRFIMTALNDTSYLRPLNIKPLNDF